MGAKKMLALIFHSGQEKEIVIRCESVAEALSRLRDSHLKTECQHWLARAQQAIENWPISYADFDEAWAALNEIRHKFTALLPAEGLDRIALDISEDLSYLASEAERKRHQKEIDEIAEALPSLAGESETAKNRLDKYRERLLHLSLLGAGARQSQWYKINLLRSRLFATAVYMILLELVLIVGMSITPKTFGIVHAQRYVVWGVVAFGGLGGFLSALHKHEPLTGSGAAFYMERAVLILRPVLGAAAGLAVYFLLLAKLVTIAPQEAFPATYFLAAFAAGFSERFFLKELSAVLSPKSEE